MRYLLVLSLLFIVSCKTKSFKAKKTDPAVSKTIKDNSQGIQVYADITTDKSQSIKDETVKKDPDLQEINNQASVIIENQRLIKLLADGIIKDTGAVAAKDDLIEEQQKTIEDQQKTIDSGNNKIYTIMGCILFLAMVYCFYSHNIWAGICCFIGVIASLAITWFVSHIGAVIGVVAVLAIGYLAHKHNKTIKDELFDTVEHFKDGYQWEHKETNNKSVNRIQSKSTQDVVKKMKKQRAKVK